MFILIHLLLTFSFLISLVSLDGVTHHAFDSLLIHSASNYPLSTYPYFINQWYNDLTFGYFTAGSIFTIPLFLLIFYISSFFQKDREKHLLFIEILKITSLTIIILYTLGYLIDDVATLLQKWYPINQFTGHFLIFVFTACLGCLFLLKKFTVTMNRSKLVIAICIFIALWGVFADIYSIFILGNPFQSNSIPPPNIQSLKNRDQITPTPKLDQMFAGQIATIFALGGYTKNSSETASMEFYNPQINQWTFGPPMQTARANEAATVYQNTIYVFGGDDEIYNKTLSSVEAFNTQTNKWDSKTSMPIGRAGEIAITVQDKIYIMGGYTDDFAPVFQVDIYDTHSNSWSTGKPIPVTNTTSKQNAYTCDAIDSQIYCPSIGEKNYTLVYDTTKNIWTSLSTENRSTVNGGIGTAINYKIYMLSLDLPDDNYLSYYDSATDSLIRVTNYNKSVENFAAVGMGDFFVVMGGKSSAEPFTDVYAINTGYPIRWENLQTLNVPRANFSAVVIPLLYGTKNTGSISGIITQDGKPTPHVQINLSTPRLVTDQHGNKSEELGYISTTTVTDTNGKYTFSSLAPNKYQIQVKNSQQNGSFSVPIYKGNQYVLLQNNQQITDYNYSQ